MNGNPTAEQQRYHDRLREIYYSNGQLHHIWGSKEKFKLLKESGINRPGEWLVIFLPLEVHEQIDSYSFDQERQMFLNQQEEYSFYFGEKSPVPEVVIDYYKQLLSKRQVIKCLA